MSETSSQNQLNDETNDDSNHINSEENESKLKLFLFNFFNNVSTDEVITYPLRLVFHIIETMQIFSIAFSPQVKIKFFFSSSFSFSFFISFMNKK